MEPMEPIKTRFAPSPTGSLHVGGARTALFSYVLARKLGGTFLLRIEDTDRARHQEQAVGQLLRDLHWLGLTWDEGVCDEGGSMGELGPYRQSERLDIYNEHLDTLLDEGKAYYAFDTSQQLDALREDAQREKRDFRYPRPATLPTREDAAAAREQGLPVVVRLLCPAGDVTIVDEVFGPVTTPADQIDDFIIQKADGWPTYHLANVVDDTRMGVNFILRGQEFLGQTWRHKLLREAFGFAEPKYAHLPLIMDMQGRKLAKRDGDVEVDAFRRAGFLPETLLNFLSLLGWSPKNDLEKFTLPELVELFDVSGIGKTNPKFDRAKLVAFNTDTAASLDEETLLVRFRDYLSITETPIPTGDDDLLRTLLQCCAGFRTFEDVVTKAGVLFADDDSYDFEPKAVKKGLRKGDPNGYAMLETITPELETLEFSADAIDTWMRAYCETHEIGMGKVAQPLRVAVTGTMISPGIGETLTLLGKDKTLARIQRCLAQQAKPDAS